MTYDMKYHEVRSFRKGKYILSFFADNKLMCVYTNLYDIIQEIHTDHQSCQVRDVLKIQPRLSINDTLLIEKLSHEGLVNLCKAMGESSSKIFFSFFH